MHEIFLSYSRRDATIVQALATALSEKGLTVWLDRSGIQEGDAYDTQIEDAIAQTRVVIVVWSKNSTKSHWVRAEAAYALGRHKLLPISIDKSEPPLQFLHIQTIEFDGWQGGCEGEAFARLTTALAKRLDHSVGGGDSVQAAATAVAAPPALIAGPPEPATRFGWLRALMVAAGLRFGEDAMEQQFQDYFRDRTYLIAQFCILLSVATYTMYGIADMASNAGVNSTRFRFMVACPLMFIFYALSRRDYAKQHSQAFISVFAIVGSVCVYISVLLLGKETVFQVQNGNGTMNFMLTIGFLALLPLSVVNTAWLGAVCSTLHGLLMLQAHVPFATSWLNYLHISSMWTVACCIAYWREYLLRRSFAVTLS